MQRQSTARRLVELIAGAYALTELDAFREGILGVVREAVPCDTASYNEVDDDPASTWYVVEPADWVPPQLAARWAPLAHENPILANFLRTHDGRPRRISDFLDEAAFHALALYREFYAPLGITGQVAFTLPSRPPIVIAIALSRCDGDFSDEELLLLGAARPHVIRAYRAAELAGARAATIAALESGLEASGSAVLVVDALGRVELATAGARELLQRRLGLDPGAARLPAWLAEQIDRQRVDPAPSLQPLLLVSEDGGEGISARVFPGPDGRGTDMIVLEPGTGGLSVAALQGLGLTRRQAEVLRWVALGRRTHAIARELGVSSRTVEKHLQHVYDQLGVRTSSDAAATAWAAVGLRSPA